MLMIYDWCDIVILVLFGLGLFLFFIYIGEILDGDLDKLMDESCYYCIYSTNPHSVRDENKRTCELVDNTGWSSEQIKKCKHRIKR